MGGREGNPDPALPSFVTGVYIPSAEGGTAFFSPRLPPLFLSASLSFDRACRIIKTEMESILMVLWWSVLSFLRYSLCSPAVL